MQKAKNSQKPKTCYSQPQLSLGKNYYLKRIIGTRLQSTIMHVRTVYDKLLKRIGFRKNVGHKVSNEWNIKKPINNLIWLSFYFQTNIFRAVCQAPVEIFQVSKYFDLKNCYCMSKIFFFQSFHLTCWVLSKRNAAWV